MAEGFAEYTEEGFRFVCVSADCSAVISGIENNVLPDFEVRRGQGGWGYVYAVSWDSSQWGLVVVSSGRGGLIDSVHFYRKLEATFACLVYEVCECGVGPEA